MIQIKKKLIKKAQVLVLIFIMAVTAGVTGCGKETTSEYRVYFVNKEGNKLIEKDADFSPAASVYDVAGQLLNEMNTKQKQDDYEVIKPENVKILDYNIQGTVININFSKEYNDMNNARELLLRAAMVNTLVQIEDISYVKFYVEGNDAAYEDGTVIGMMSQDDFVDDSSEDIERVEWKDIKIYYANKLGDKLVQKTEKVAYSKNMSIEKLVVEKLINGPNNTTEFSTVPKDLKLLSISTNNGVCYVNLSSVFLTEMVNVSGEVSLYSIVNSLCAIDSVDSVKIMINGDSGKIFRENISLENEYTFNDSVISSSISN